MKRQRIFSFVLGFLFAIGQLSISWAQGDVAGQDSSDKSVNVAILDGGIKKKWMGNLGDRFFSALRKKKLIVKKSESEELIPDNRDHAAEVADIFSHFLLRERSSEQGDYAFYDVRILPEESGFANMTKIIDGLDWIAKQNREPGKSDIHVAYLNVYAGSGGSRPKRTGLRKSIEKVFQSGTTIVVGAGDGGGSIVGYQRKAVPAAYPETVTVSSSYNADWDDNLRILAPFSNFGEQVDVTEDKKFAEGLPNVMDGSTLYSAVGAAAAAARYVHAAIDSVGKIPSPRQVKYELIKQGKKERFLRDDPDGEREPTVNHDMEWKGNRVPDNFLEGVSE